jgi:hypothetical protein
MKPAILYGPQRGKRAAGPATAVIDDATRAARTG